jgi:hypothetical protein
VTDYPFHPIAGMFPLLEGGEFAAAVDDIRAHGLLESIVLFEGMILDGRNRDRACREAGVEPRYREMTFDSYADAVNYVISANIHRRHLTAEQKRELIEKLLKAKPELSNRQIAKQVKDDDKKVARIRTELEATAAIPQLEKTTGADGKARPARKAPPMPPLSSPTKATPPRILAVDAAPALAVFDGQFLGGHIVERDRTHFAYDSNGRLAGSYTKPTNRNARFAADSCVMTAFVDHASIAGGSEGVWQPRRGPGESTAPRSRRIPNSKIRRKIPTNSNSPLGLPT